VAGETVVDQLNFAHQSAVTYNLPVEVRLYWLPDYAATATSTPTVYRAFQFFLIKNTGPVALGKPVYFQSPVYLTTTGTAASSIFSGAAQTALSSLILQTPNSTDPTQSNYGPSLPPYQMNYEYSCFHFKPSGATDLPIVSNVQYNFITLALENDRAVGSGGNFITIQIDPYSGAVKSYRP
jgi:uncharacterized protein (TIGR02596 family)